MRDEGRGVLLALSAAATCTVIDSGRKAASSHLPNAALVGLVAVLDAVLALTGVSLAGGFNGITFESPHVFSLAVLSSSALLLYSKVLYQTALSISQLSLTVPYLSFTPMFLLGTAWLFVGEAPSLHGLAGVLLIAAGGYLLSRQGPAAKPSKSPASSSTPASLISTPHGSTTLLAAMGHPHAAAVPAPTCAAPGPRVSGSGHLSLPDGSTPGGAQPQRLDTGDHGAETPPPAHCISLAAGVHTTPRELASLLGGQAPGAVVEKMSQRLAAAYSAISTSNGTALPGAAGHKAGVKQGLHSGPPRTTTHTGWVPGWATTLVKHWPPWGGAGAGRNPSQRGAPHAPAGLLGGGMARWEPGTSYMLCVAAMWSITASLDKIGILHSPNVWVYMALQRLVIGAASLVYLLIQSPHTLSLLHTRHLGVLLAISCSELLAVVLFLEAIKYIFVSYVVAIKRCSILLSTLTAGIIFRESICSRLPFILLMIAGVITITVDVDSTTLHTVH